MVEAVSDETGAKMICATRPRRGTRLRISFVPILLSTVSFLSYYLVFVSVSVSVSDSVSVSFSVFFALRGLIEGC